MLFSYFEPQQKEIIETITYKVNFKNDLNLLTKKLIFKHYTEKKISVTYKKVNRSDTKILKANFSDTQTMPHIC